MDDLTVVSEKQCLMGEVGTGYACLDRDPLILLSDAGYMGFAERRPSRYLDCGSEDSHLTRLAAVRDLCAPCTLFHVQRALAARCARHRSVRMLRAGRRHKLFLGRISQKETN